MNPDVFAGSGNSSLSLPSAASSGGQPVTGKSTSPYNSPCGSSYTVQSGDTLSSIARTCLISVQDLLAINPAITNQHLITVGQKITIYNTLPVITAQPTVAVVPTAVQGAAALATLPAGLKPGDPVNIELKGFPAGAQVRVGIGRVGETPTNVTTTKTDPNGVLKINIPVPLHANADEKWTVTVTTVNRPRMQVTAVPFTIQK